MKSRKQKTILGVTLLILFYALFLFVPYPLIAIGVVHNTTVNLKCRSKRTRVVAFFAFLSLSKSCLSVI